MTVDELSVELTELLTEESLEKKLPPKLAYRLQSWYKKFGIKRTKAAVSNVAKSLEERNSLKKNEILASVYENKSVRLDFGKNTDEKVKQKAMEWAKRRGLLPVEASLNKSNNAPSYVIFGSQPEGLCVGSLKLKN